MPFVGWVIKWTRLGRYPLIVQQLDWGSFEVMRWRNLFVCEILNWAITFTAITFTCDAISDH